MIAGVFLFKAHMDFGAWLSKFDPNQAPITVLVFALAAFGMTFMLKSWWPWFTKDYWPARQAANTSRIQAEIDAQKEQNGIQRSTLEALTKIAVMLEKVDERTEQHDGWTRNWAQWFSESGGGSSSKWVFPRTSSTTIAESATVTVSKLGDKPAEVKP